MKTFINKFGIGIFALCCLVIVSAGILLFGGDSYNLGKSSVTSQLDQTTNEFTIKLKELEFDVAQKEAENIQLKHDIDTYTFQVEHLIQEKISLETQVQSLINERDNAIASGSTSQETINNLNTQIDDLNNLIEEKDLLITQVNSEISTLNQTIEDNNVQIEKCNNRLNVLISILDKTVENISAEDLEGITFFGRYAFYDCKNLKIIEFPSSLVGLGENVFYQSSLNQADFSKCSNLTTIGLNAFLNVTSLNKVILSSSLTSLGSAVFSGCTNLQEVDFSRCSELTTIGSSAFKSCTKLNNIDLSSCTKLTLIDNYAFQNCSNLSNMQFPINLTTIGSWSFENTGFINLDLSDLIKLTTLGHQSFQKCTKLLSVVLPDSLTVLANVFYYCSYLEEIILPYTITSIDAKGFVYCSRLINVTVLATTPPVLLNPSSLPVNVKFYVYDVELYSSAEGFSEVGSSRFVEISTIEE